jgi:formate hydrogenlyase subunit 3/multisubunit Na+/H+ antiporter MnhD subunit
MSIAINEVVPFEQFIFYLSGVAVAGVTGYFCLKTVQKLDNDITLDKFHGYSYEKPAIAFVFLLCCLASLGFPFTPTFLGIDLLFTHIQEKQIILIMLTSLSFIFIELALLRIYSRVFLGQHKKNYHPIAYRSS